MYEILTYLNDHKVLGMLVVGALAYVLTKLVTSNVRRVPTRRPEPRINRYLKTQGELIQDRR